MTFLGDTVLIEEILKSSIFFLSKELILKELEKLI